MNSSIADNNRISGTRRTSLKGVAFQSRFHLSWDFGCNAVGQLIHFPSDFGCNFIG